MRKTALLAFCCFLLLSGCTAAGRRGGTASGTTTDLPGISGPIGSNIMIVVRKVTTSREEYLAVESAWRYVDENIAVVKRPGDFAGSGLRVGIADRNFQARLDIAVRNAKSLEDSTVFVVATNGASAYIDIGEEISIPRFMYFGRWYTAVEYDFRKAGRSLKTTPRKLPSGAVDIELVPVFSRFMKDGLKIELTELSTRVTVNPGEMIVIGGSDTSSEDVATALFSYSKEKKATRTIITVMPRME